MRSSGHTQVPHMVGEKKGGIGEMEQRLTSSTAERDEVYRALLPFTQRFMGDHLSKLRC